MRDPFSRQAGDPFRLHPDDASLDRTALDRIFKAGIAARRAGRGPCDNPFAPGSEERDEWAAGWAATIEDEDPAPDAGS